MSCEKDETAARGGKQTNEKGETKMRQVRDEDKLEKLFIYTFFRAEKGRGTLHNRSASEPIWGG